MPDNKVSPPPILSRHADVAPVPVIDSEGRSVDMGRPSDEISESPAPRRLRARPDLSGSTVRFNLRLRPSTRIALEHASWDLAVGKSELIDAALTAYLEGRGYRVGFFYADNAGDLPSTGP